MHVVFGPSVCWPPLFWPEQNSKTPKGNLMKRVKYVEDSESAVHASHNSSTLIICKPHSISMFSLSIKLFSSKWDINQYLKKYPVYNTFNNWPNPSWLCFTLFYCLVIADDVWWHDNWHSLGKGQLGMCHVPVTVLVHFDIVCFSYMKAPL